jgi:hypothetical protein
MTDWTAGYVADIGYTFGYYQELNPLRARLAFLNAGLVPPNNGVHCELGYGQGMSANIHAAASGSVKKGSDPFFVGFGFCCFWWCTVALPRRSIKGVKPHWNHQAVC